jgi:ribosomal protein L28
MSRACAICGKTSMGGFNPQSTGMNRVRAHRRMVANLQKMHLPVDGVERSVLVCTRCQRTRQKTA